MDLGAYAQIEILQNVLVENGLESFPRLRGLRLMSNEEEVTEEDIKEIIECQFNWIYDKFCYSRFEFGDWMEMSYATELLRKKYLIIDKDDDTIGVRWDRIHGKHRKALKFELKKRERAIRAQYAMFNKYAGRNDVLYIQSRTGGGNWPYYSKELKLFPGLLDHIDDSFDSTYADYYYQIKPVEKGEHDDP